MAPPIQDYSFFPDFNPQIPLYPGGIPWLIVSHLCICFPAFLAFIVLFLSVPHHWSHWTSKVQFKYHLLQEAFWVLCLRLCHFFHLKIQKFIQVSWRFQPQILIICAHVWSSYFIKAGLPHTSTLHRLCLTEQGPNHNGSSINMK